MMRRLEESSMHKYMFIQRSLCDDSQLGKYSEEGIYLKISRINSYQYSQVRSVISMAFVGKTFTKRSFAIYSLLLFCFYLFAIFARVDSLYDHKVASSKYLLVHELEIKFTSGSTINKYIVNYNKQRAIFIVSLFVYCRLFNMCFDSSGIAETCTKLNDGWNSKQDRDILDAKTHSV